MPNIIGALMSEEKAYSRTLNMNGRIHFPDDGQFSSSQFNAGINRTPRSFTVSVNKVGRLIQQRGRHRFSERDSCQIYRRFHGVPQENTAFVLIRRTCLKLVQCT